VRPFSSLLGTDLAPIFERAVTIGAQLHARLGAPTLRLQTRQLWPGT